MKPARLSSWDVAYALDMCVACAISYWVITHAGISILDRDLVAGITPQDAWHQPLLRLVDTVVGVGVGVACKWAASFLYF